MKLKPRVVRSELEPELVVRSESECSEIETTFTGNLWLPVGDSNNAGRRKLRHQKTADQGGIKCQLEKTGPGAMEPDKDPGEPTSYMCHLENW